MEIDRSLHDFCYQNGRYPSIYDYNRTGWIISRKIELHTVNYAWEIGSETYPILGDEDEPVAPDATVVQFVAEWGMPHRRRPR